MFNPRFPHTFSAYRARIGSDGLPETGEDGDPIYDRITFVKCVLSDSEPVRDSNGIFVTERCCEMPFGYRTSSENTRKQADVHVSDYRLACPMFLTELKPGDVLVMKDYVREYRGEVVKQTTFNLGTNVWVNEIKN
jgi:hypothetical protein